MSKVSGCRVCLSLVASFILVALLGCAAAETPTPQATFPPSPAAAKSPTPSPSPYAPPSTITLTLWTTEAFIPSPDTATGEVMEGIYRGFQEAHPDIAVQFVPKRPYGTSCSGRSSSSLGMGSSPRNWLTISSPSFVRRAARKATS